MIQLLNGIRNGMNCKGNKKDIYALVLENYNRNPNGPDFLFLLRTCYGGIIRFRKDGYMSTPCGVHNPISPEKFSFRVKEWNKRVGGIQFICQDC